MKQLAFFIFLLSSLNLHLQAQNVDDYQPDSDGDGCVGMSDLLSLLSVFGSCESQAFACGEPVSYQGDEYATVLIGEQCWFAENLRNSVYNNGDSIPSNLDDATWGNLTSGGVATYGEDGGCGDDSPDINACDPLQSEAEYGHLYNWHAVIDPRGLCPDGWHIPSDEEWMILELALGMDELQVGNTGWRGSDQGMEMKAEFGWSNEGNGTNVSGFRGLPGGYRGISGYFYGAGSRGDWWTSSADSSGAWSRQLSSNYTDFFRGSITPQDGFSVRCIYD